MFTTNVVICKRVQQKLLCRMLLPVRWSVRLHSLNNIDMTKNFVNCGFSGRKVKCIKNAYFIKSYYVDQKVNYSNLY